jgi:hypothetical protein
MTSIAPRNDQGFEFCKLADDQLGASMRTTAFYRARTGHQYRLALL